MTTPGDNDVPPPAAPAPQPARVTAWTRRSEWRVLAVLTSVVTLFLAPLIGRIFNIGEHLDWKYFQMLWEADRKSLVEYGQLPLWNPWYCGGNAQLANPQTQFFSVASLFSLLFGASVGIKLHILLHYMLGAWGTWKLARFLSLIHI